jgi:hypothetical protein
VIAAPIVAAILFIIAVTIFVSVLSVQSTRDAAEQARREAEEQARINLAVSEASLRITQITTEAVAAMYEAGRQGDGR